MADKSKFFSLLNDAGIFEAVEIAHSASDERELLLAAIGDYFLKSGNLDSAGKFFVSSIASKPNPQAQFGAGEVLLKKGMVKESISFFFKSALHKSHKISSLLKIGMAERLLGNIKASLQAYIMAKNLGYDKFVLDINIAILLSDMGEHEKAESYYESAIRKAPSEDKVRFNYSLHLLSKGEFGAGLEFYESRPWCFKAPGKEWDGTPGRMVLVLAEQGYGDMIQFARFLPEVHKVSEGVCVACDKNVARLISSFGGVDEIVGLDDIDRASEKYTTHCRIMSIPYLLSMDVKSFKFNPITTDSERVDYWRSRMNNPKGVNVGICWQGGKRNHSEMIFNDRKRSIELSILHPLLDTKGFNFYSLQKDWKEPDSRVLELMEECGDFMDFASLVSNMDLVISVDTAVAHVAGSLGVPVWMLSRLGGCWRWGNMGSDTFWYPSMRIYRQSTMDDWTDVVKKVRDDLVSFGCSG